MHNKKIKIQIIAVATTLVFVSALVIGLSLRDSASKGIEVKESSSKVTNEKVILQQKEEESSSEVTNEKIVLKQKEEESSSKVTNEKVVLQQKEEAPAEQPNKTETIDITVQYMTISQKGNIDIAVNYLNPLIGSTDVLTFEVSLGTHSIDLTEYKDIRKFVELRTDTGVVVTEGFEWVVENAENHHINGILKIKNNMEEKPIIGQDTKSFKLIFKNIPDEGIREHLYEG